MQIIPRDSRNSNGNAGFVAPQSAQDGYESETMSVSVIDGSMDEVEPEPWEAVLESVSLELSDDTGRGYYDEYDELDEYDNTPLLDGVLVTESAEPLYLSGDGSAGSVADDSDMTSSGISFFPAGIGAADAGMDYALSVGKNKRSGFFGFISGHRGSSPSGADISDAPAGQVKVKSHRRKRLRSMVVGGCAIILMCAVSANIGAMSSAPNTVIADDATPMSATPDGGTSGRELPESGDGTDPDLVGEAVLLGLDDRLLGDENADGNIVSDYGIGKDDPENTVSFDTDTDNNSIAADTEQVLPPADNRSDTMSTRSESSSAADVSNAARENDNAASSVVNVHQTRQNKNAGNTSSSVRNTNTSASTGSTASHANKSSAKTTKNKIQSSSATKKKRTSTKSPSKRKSSTSTKKTNKAGTEAVISKVSANKMPKYNGSPYVYVNNGNPNFTAAEKKKKNGTETYKKLDSLGRSTYAFAVVGKETIPKSGDKRGNINSVTPTGWRQAKWTENGKTQYLYNRCHLIGWQLTAENANARNIITGTRYLNIQGMLPFENVIAKYVEKGKHVRMKVIPVYKGKNLVASGIQMMAESVEDKGKAISFNVYCYNVQPGVEIDYKSGKCKAARKGVSVQSITSKNNTGTSNITSTSSASTTSTVPVASVSTADKTEREYVLNTSSKKFHLPNCRYVSSMIDANKNTETTSYAGLLNRGYSACKVCLG